jgi:hypothetical protein
VRLLVKTKKAMASRVKLLTRLGLLGPAQPKIKYKKYKKTEK